MITLKEWMEIVDCRITEGSDYFSNLSRLYILSSWNGEQDGYSFDIVFDPKEDQRVYLVEANDFKNNRAYRLKDPALDVDDIAWDGVKYVDLESDDDFIQKALAIKAGEDYDERVVIPIDFPEEELMVLFKLAHEADMSFNDFIEHVLKEKLKEMGFDK